MAGFEQWCIVELMGHAKIAGKVTEETVFGAAMMRVDVPKTNRREGFTRYYAAGAIYSFTPTDEATATLAAGKFDEAPVQPWILPASPALAAKVSADYLDDFDDDDDPEYDDFSDYDPDEEDDLPVSRPASRTNDQIAAAKAAHELLAGKFVIFDTETTGFHAFEDEIVQIAAIDQAGAVVLNSYVKPTKPIPNSDYHGISDETVKDAPGFPALYQQIKAALDGKVVVAYNYAYDRAMLDGCCDMHKVEALAPLAHDCAMELFAQFYGEWNDYHESYTWKKLNFAMSHFGLSWDGKEHDALADAKATLAVLKKMAEWYTDYASGQAQSAAGEAPDQRLSERKTEQSATPIQAADPVAQSEGKDLGF